MTAQAREPTQYSTTLADASGSPGTLMAQQVRGLTASVDVTAAALRNCVARAVVPTEARMRVLAEPVGSGEEQISRIAACRMPGSSPSGTRDCRTRRAYNLVVRFSRECHAMGISMTPEPVQRLGDFEILREIGRGGMGIVYEARQISLNRKVALKALSAGLGLTEKAVGRFRREAEAAARLHHTNIVPVYATGEDKGIHYYAMELIEGPSLDHVIRQLRKGDAPPSGTPIVAPSSAESVPSTPTGPYVPAAPGTPSSASSTSTASGNDHFDRIARMVAEVADGLEYAHRLGVIHRDIKPSNLLLSPEGRLSINDFGLARVLEQPGMTLTGEFVGTPAYMSPEQIAVGRAPLDHRTDIYSLGATLYELLTLQSPFHGERRDQMIAQIMHKEPRPPRALNRQIPVDLETICLKAMENDRIGAISQRVPWPMLRRYLNRFAIQARAQVR